MKITLTRATRAAGSTPLLFVVVGETWSPALATWNEATGGRLVAELTRQGFTGSAGSVATFQAQGTLAHDYLVVLGVGVGSSSAAWFRAAQTIVTRSVEARRADAHVVVADDVGNDAGLEFFAEGLGLSQYQFTDLKRPAAQATRFGRATIALPTVAAKQQNAVARGLALARGACFARDLTNLPAAMATPTYLAKAARTIGRSQRLRVRILDEAEMRRLGMGALLGVAQGSAQPPRFIELIYQPKRRAGRKLPVIALAGKGVTFDSGGLSLKPANAMESQKRDMAGGAAVLGVMSVIRELAPAVEVRAYVGATENMPGSRAMKPGDVLTALNGTTIEVLNTDAEGRLVLADVMSFAVRAKPDLLIDLATLTGAVRATFGPRIAGILGTDRELVGALIRAGAASGESLWELPLVDEYRADIDSAVADIKNMGEGYAGTIIGGLFLREFAGGLPWAHIDFSSTVVTAKPHPGHPRGAAGFGVRTLLRFLQSAGR